MRDQAVDPKRVRTTPAARSTLVVVCLVSTVMALNMSSLNVALPTLTREFRATPVEGSWLLLSYMVSSTACLLLFGRLSDAWGQRRLYVGGLAVFTLASFLCGLAPTVEVLIGLRVLAAVGGAVLLSNGATLIHQAFPPSAIGGAMGLYAASFPVANLVGPTFGGFLVDLAGWRWVFWFNVPLCALALVAGHRLLPRREERSRNAGLDLAGNFLIMALVLLLTVGITLASETGWTDPVVVASLLLAVMLVPLLLGVERRSSHPVIDVRVLRRVGRLFLAGFFNGAGRFPVVVLASLYLQGVVGAGPGQAGLLLLPMPVGSILASLTIGRLSRRVAARQIMAMGSVVGTIGVLVVTLAVWVGGTEVLLLGLFVVGWGTGLFIGSNATALLESAPAESIGVVNATRLMLQNTGNVLSLAFALTLLTAPLPPGLGEGVLAATVPAGEVDRVVVGFLMACGLLLCLGLVGVHYSVRSSAGRPPGATAGAVADVRHDARSEAGPDAGGARRRPAGRVSSGRVRARLFRQR